MKFIKPEEQILGLSDKAMRYLLKENYKHRLFCMQMGCPTELLKDGCHGCIGELRMAELLEVSSKIETKEHMLEAITVINLLD